MKLNKASEEALKGIARLLKNLKEADGAVALSEFQPDIRAVEKDLRQLRAHIKELPSPEQASPVLSMPNVVIFRNEDHLDIKIAPDISNPQAELDLEQALNELRALRNDTPVQFAPKGQVIDLAYESLKSIRETYVETYGPLPEAMISNDIDYEVREIIKQSKAELKPIEALGWKAPDAAQELQGDGTGTPLPEFVTGTLEAVSVSPAYELTFYVNPEQITKGSNLIAVRKDPEGIFTEALYRKKT